MHTPKGKTHRIGGHEHPTNSFYQVLSAEAYSKHGFNIHGVVFDELHTDNIYIRTDPAGNIKPDKEKSTEKIDGAVATIMALDRAIRCGNDTSESVYDSRGLLFL